MDNEGIEFCKRTCFAASTMGFIGRFEIENGKTRMVLVAPDGRRIAGEFKDTKQEAVESCCKQYIQ